MIRVVDADSSTFTFGVYDIDGAIRVRESNGEPRGLYDPDGAIRVTISDGTTMGLYAPDGSWYVTEEEMHNGAFRVIAPTGIGSAATFIQNEDSGLSIDLSTTNLNKQVAVKNNGTVTTYSLQDFLANAGTGPKLTVQKDGTVAWSDHNLIRASENFADANWTGMIGGVTNGTTLTDDDTTGAEFKQQSITGNLIGERYSLHYWLLKDDVETRNVGFGFDPAAGNYRIDVNSKTGAWAERLITATNYATVITTVTDARTHWKISISFDANSTSVNVVVIPAVSTVLGTGDPAAVGSATVSKVHYHRGSVTVGYLTTTTAARMGIPIDYRDGVPALLIEPAATNLVLQSGGLDLANWSKLGATMGTPIAGPYGLLHKIIAATTSTSHQVYQTVSKAATAIQYTVSCDVKAGEWEYPYLIIQTNGSANRAYAYFDLVNGVVGAISSVGTVTGQTSSIKHIGDGVYRISHTAMTDTNTTIVALVGIANALNVNAPPGDNVSGLYAGNMQLEAGPVATSYIPTYAAQVTRARDSVSAVNPLTFSGSVSTMVEFSFAAQSPVVDSILSIDDGTTGNLLLTYLSGTGAVTTYAYTGAAIQSQLTLAVGVANSKERVSARYEANNFGASRNGGSVLTDTAGLMPSATLSKVALGYYGASTGAVSIPVHISKLAIVPRAWNDAELALKSAA